MVEEALPGRRVHRVRRRHPLLPGERLHGLREEHLRGRHRHRELRVRRPAAPEEERAPAG